MKQKGFTLIELLVVISVIGLLASVILVSLNSARQKARDAKRKADLRQLATALNLYYNDNDIYPICDISLPYPDACQWSTWIPGWSNMLPSQYISKIPIDPQNVDLINCDVVANCHIYRYCSINGGKNFILAVNLENPTSPPMTNNAGCTTGGPNYYWIGQ